MKKNEDGIFGVSVYAIGTIVVTFIFFSIVYMVVRNTYDISLGEFNRWDARLFIEVAEKGYSNTTEGRSYITYWPLQPLLIRLVGSLIGSFPVGALVVSNVCYLVAMIFFYKLLRKDFDKNLSFRTLIYLSIFPTAYFLHSGYSESLFLMLTFIAVYFARERKWFLASVAGMFLTLSRINGIVVFPYMIVEYLILNKFDLKNLKKDFLWIFLIPMGVLFYLFLNYRIFGDPFEFLRSFRYIYWEYPTVPWGALMRIWNKFYVFNPADWIIEGALTALFWVFSLVTVIASFKKVRLSYFVFGLLNFLFFTMTPTWSSMPRFALTFFPIFIVLSHWGKDKLTNLFISSLFLLLQGFFITLFLQEHWAF